MDRKRNSPGTVLSKGRLKDLCKEDKAKVGELIDKLALEKREKISLEDQIIELTSQVQKLQIEKTAAFQDKEKMQKKLEKCMELMKEFPKPSSLPRVDVYTQTHSTDNFSKTISTSDPDFFTSTYDDKLFAMVAKIENEDITPFDATLLTLVEELEFSD